MDSSDQMDFGLPGSAPMPDPPATADGPPKEAQAAPRLEPEYGWIKMQRNPDLMELVGKNHHAAILLLVIAFRAWRGSGFNRHGLSSGQAFLGKFKADYSMTEKEYRNAKKVLEAEGFATFQRASKGTIATLCDARIFDINPESEGGQRAIRGRSEGGQGANAGRMQGDQRATNKELKKVQELKNVQEGKELKEPRKRAKAAPTQADFEAWIAEYKAKPLYQPVNVEGVFHAMMAWCQDNDKPPGKARLVNWLNRELKRAELSRASAPTRPAATPEKPKFTTGQIDLNAFLDQQHQDRSKR